jgi:hypothetical protein
MKRMKVLGVAMLAVFLHRRDRRVRRSGGRFHSESEKTFLFGEQEGENVFTTSAGKVKCKEASFDSLVGQARSQ